MRRDVFVEYHHCFDTSSLFAMTCLLVMLADCEDDGTMLPSLESFTEKWRLPKVHYLFFKYIFKRVVGNANWKSKNAEGARLGAIILEAYAHSLLYNHYVSWVYDYKVNNPTTSLKTEYDKDEVVQGGSNNDEDQPVVPTPLFSGGNLALDLLEVSVPSAAGTTNGNDDFGLIMEEGPERTAAKEHAQSISQSIKARIEADRTSNGGDGNGTPTGLRQYNDIEGKLREDVARANATDLPVETSQTKKRRRSATKAELSADLTSNKRKTKKESNAIQGWTVKGKRYVEDMVLRISQDETSGVRRKWETMY